jgi:Transposase and inactivated derivatives
MGCGTGFEYDGGDTSGRREHVSKRAVFFESPRHCGQLGFPIGANSDSNFLLEEVWMRPERFVISDTSWSVIEPLLPGTHRDRGVTAKDNRLFLEAVLWKVRVGGAWRDLPTGFGEWNSVFRRFRRWAERGVFQRIFEALSGEPDFEYVLVDGTIISAHQKASGAKGGLSIKRSAARRGD